MPLQFADAPVDGVDFLNSHLDAFERRRTTVRPRPGLHKKTGEIKNYMGPARPIIKATGSHYAPLAAYRLHIRSILAGDDILAKAQPWGHFYLLVNDKGVPKAKAHIQPDIYGQLSSIRLSFGSYARHAEHALGKLAGHHRVKVGTYEVRALSCPHIYFSAIWLKSMDGGKDLLHPIIKPPKLMGGEAPPYPADEYLMGLQKLAATLVAKVQAFAARRGEARSIGLAP